MGQRTSDHPHDHRKLPNPVCTNCSPKISQRCQLKNDAEERERTGMLDRLWTENRPPWHGPVVSRSLQVDHDVQPVFALAGKARSPGPPAEFREHALACLPVVFRLTAGAGRRQTGQVVLVRALTPWVRSACLSSAPHQAGRRASTPWERSVGHAARCDLPLELCDLATVLRVRFTNRLHRALDLLAGQSGDLALNH